MERSHTWETIDTYETPTGHCVSVQVVHHEMCSHVHIQVTDENAYEINANWPRVNLWSCVFCDYIANIDAFLRNIDTSKSGRLQENDRIRIFEIPQDDIIRQEYIQKIENLANPSGCSGRKESA